jgi:prepilin-type N-terminal cleavage/methylation domain-containing protein
MNIRGKQSGKQSGFSLIELLVVVAIIMAITAISIPSIQKTVQGLRLRATVTNVNGLVQQLRMQAVRSNRATTLRIVGPVGVNGTILYIDTNGNSAFDVGEASIQLPLDTVINNGTGGPASLPPVLPAIVFPPWNRSASNPADNSIVISFNERGLPCTNLPSCQTPLAYFIYFQQTRALGTPGWAALTVTQAGRVKAYTYDGGAAGTWN